MGYMHCDGMTYGIVPKRNIIDSVLINLPIINLLYTRKICIKLTKRTERGEPICGIFKNIRIYKNQSTLIIKFIPPEIFTNVLLTIDNLKCPDSCRELDPYHDTKYFQNLEYTVNLLVHEKK